jgi:hypothetical protein
MAHYLFVMQTAFSWKLGEQFIRVSRQLCIQYMKASINDRMLYFCEINKKNDSFGEPRHKGQNKTNDTEVKEVNRFIYLFIYLFICEVK